MGLYLWLFMCIYFINIFDIEIFILKFWVVRENGVACCVVVCWMLNMGIYYWSQAGIPGEFQVKLVGGFMER